MPIAANKPAKANKQKRCVAVDVGALNVFHTFSSPSLIGVRDQIVPRQPHACDHIVSTSRSNEREEAVTNDK